MSDFYVPGQFYLFAAPWDWSFVGCYVRHENFQEIVIEDGGYFSRTGATFDKLCAEGLVGDWRRGDNQGSRFHPTANGEQQMIPAGGPKWKWLAPTPWVTEKRKR